MINRLVFFKGYTHTFEALYMFLLFKFKELRVEDFRFKTDP